MFCINAYAPGDQLFPKSSRKSSWKNLSVELTIQTGVFLHGNWLFIPDCKPIVNHLRNRYLTTTSWHTLRIAIYTYCCHNTLIRQQNVHNFVDAVFGQCVELTLYSFHSSVFLREQLITSHLLRVMAWVCIWITGQNRLIKHGYPITIFSLFKV